MKCAASQRGEWCFRCYSGAKARKYYPGHFGYRHCPVQRERITDMIRRQSGSSEGDSGRTVAARDTVMEADRPLLMEYLTAMTFADGSERQTSTLLVFAAEGLWKVCLNDRAEEQALWASGPDVASALDALERMLDTEAPDWRRTARPQARKKS